MTSQKHCTKKKLNLTVQMKADILQQWIDADLTIGIHADRGRTRRRRQFGGIDRVEAHVERPKAQRCVEDLSSAHTLRVVSVGRLRGCHWPAVIY